MSLPILCRMSARRKQITARASSSNLPTLAGVPAHVTIIYPFLPAQDVNEDVLRDLRWLVTRHPSFTVTFADCGRFPDVLFLVLSCP